MEENSGKTVLWTGNFIKIILINLFLFLSFQMLLPALPLYVKELGGDGSLVGLVTGLFTLSALLIRPVAGIFLDRLGRKGIFLAGLGLFILSSYSYALTAGVGVILLLRFLHGFSWGAASTASTTLGTDNIPRSRFGEGMGFVGLSTSLAMAMGPAAGLSIMDELGFRQLFTVSAILGLGALGLALFLRYDPIPKGQGGAAPKGPFLEKGAVKASLLVFLLASNYATQVSFLSVYAAEKEIAGIGLYFTASALAMLISRPIVGKLIDRKGVGQALLPGLALVLVSTLLLALGDSLPGLVLVGLIYGVGFGAAQGSLQAMAVLESGPERLGAANATFLTGFDSGIGVGSMIFGMIAGFSGYVQMYLLAMVPVALAALLYFLPVRRREPVLEPVPEKEE